MTRRSYRQLRSYLHQTSPFGPARARDCCCWSPPAMITATIDKSVLLSNLEVQRNSEFEHVHQRKEKELNETAWSLFVATEALRDILVDGGRRTWGELSPKQVTALWIGAASSIGAVGLGLDWGRKWLLLPLAAAVFRAPSDHRAVVFALCFAAILLGLELFILKGTQIDGAPAPSPQLPALSRRRRRWLFHVRARLVSQRTGTSRSLTRSPPFQTSSARCIAPPSRGRAYPCFLVRWGCSPAVASAMEAR